MQRDGDGGDHDDAQVYRIRAPTAIRGAAIFASPPGTAYTGARRRHAMLGRLIAAETAFGNMWQIKSKEEQLETSY